MFVAAMLLVPAAGSVTTFLLAWELMAVASLVLVLAEHTRAQVRSAALVYAVMTQLGFVAILVGLMVLSAAGGADRFADLRRIPQGALHRGLSVDDGGVRVEGRTGAAARLVAARPPGGAQPGVGADERGDGQPRGLRHLSRRPAAARAGSALVGARLDGRRRGVGALWRGAGFGGHGSQTATCLFDNREPWADHAGVGGCDPVRGLRRVRAGDDRRGRGHAAPDRARGVQKPRIPGGRVGAGRDRAARPRPAGWSGPPDAGDHHPVRGGRARSVWAAPGRRLRQRVAAGPVADPHGSRPRHRPGT